MNPEYRQSRWCTFALVVGFTLGIGRILNDFSGLPVFGASRIPTTEFGILLALSILALIVGFVQLARRKLSRFDRILVITSIGIVLLFAAAEPTMYIAPDPLQHDTYSLTACAVTAIGLVGGCVAAAEITYRGMSGIAMGTILFWLTVAWKLWANYDAFQRFNELFG